MADKLKLETRTSGSKPVIDVGRERISKSQFPSFGMERHFHVELDMRMAALEKGAQLKLIIKKCVQIARRGG